MTGVSDSTLTEETGLAPAGPLVRVPLVASLFIIFALLALIGTPVLMTWRLDALHKNGDATTGRAHLLTDSLKTLFVEEIVLLEQIRKGDPHSEAHYRRVRASQDLIIVGLREVAPRISTAATDRVASR